MPQLEQQITEQEIVFRPKKRDSAGRDEQQQRAMDLPPASGSRALVPGGKEHIALGGNKPMPPPLSVVDESYAATVAAAHAGGLDMDAAASWRILELARPDIADWLSRDENHEGACWLMNLKGQAAIDEVDRIAARLDAQGFAQDPPIDAYLKARREAKTAGLSTQEMLALRGSNSAVSEVDAHILARKLNRRRP